MSKDRHPHEPYRRALLALREELAAEAACGAEGAAAVELDQTRVGRLSRMDALQAQAMSVEAQRRRKALGREVDAALQRLEAGHYGVCEECDEDIPPGRLQHSPAARLCVACAGQRERS